MRIKKKKSLKDAAAHHLSPLAHPHHRFRVPEIQSADGEAERREAGGGERRRREDNSVGCSLVPDQLMR